MSPEPAHIEICTERLLLRPTRPSDARRLTALVNDLGVTRMLSNVPHPYDLEAAEAFLSGRFDRPELPAWTFAVDQPAVGLIGVISLSYAEDPWPELGYWLGRSFWSQGFATEAARAVAAWASSDAGLRALVAGHYVDNPASGRVLEKADFLYTGEVRPRFSMARGEVVATRMMVRLS